VDFLPAVKVAEVDTKEHVLATRRHDQYENLLAVKAVAR
jgi:hypothetical protein